MLAASVSSGVSGATVTTSRVITLSRDTSPLYTAMFASIDRTHPSRWKSLDG